MTERIETKFKAAEIDAPVMSDTDMVSHLIGYGEQLLQSQGMIHPMVVGLKADGQQLAFCLDDIHPQKNVALDGARHILHQWGAVKYATLIESWFLEATKGEVPDVMPSQSERRKEAVTVAVCDKTGVLAFEMREIERDDKGASLGKAIISKAAAFSGTFTELLQGSYDGGGVEFVRRDSN